MGSWERKPQKMDTLLAGQGAKRVFAPMNGWHSIGFFTLRVRVPAYDTRLISYSGLIFVTFEFIVTLITFAYLSGLSFQAYWFGNVSTTNWIQFGVLLKCLFNKIVLSETNKTEFRSDRHVRLIVNLHRSVPEPEQKKVMRYLKLELFRFAILRISDLIFVHPTFLAT